MKGVRVLALVVVLAVLAVWSVLLAAGPPVSRVGTTRQPPVHETSTALRDEQLPSAEPRTKLPADGTAATAPTRITTRANKAAGRGNQVDSPGNDSRQLFQLKPLTGRGWRIGERYRYFATRRVDDWFKELNENQLVDVVVGPENSLPSSVAIYGDGARTTPLLSFPRGARARAGIQDDWKRCGFGPPATIAAAPTTRILIAGPSHMRYLAIMVCWILQLDGCNQIHDHYRLLVHCTRNDDTEVAGQPVLTFVQVNYDVDVKLRHIPTNVTYTHVVHQRGTWDLLFGDRDPTTLVGNVVANATALLRHLAANNYSSGDFARVLSPPPPPMQFFVYSEHHYHRSRRGPRLSAGKAKWLTGCFKPSRVKSVRKSQHCALKTLVTESVNASLVEFHLLDYSTMTAEAPRQYVDDAGHHYRNIILEAIAMDFIGTVCATGKNKTDAAARTMITDGIRNSCMEVAELQKTNVRSERCSCHIASVADSAFCKSLGKFLMPIEFMSKARG